MRIESLGSRGLSACAADVHNRAWLFRYGRWRQFTVTIAVTLYQVVLHRNRQFVHTRLPISVGRCLEF